MNFHVNELYVYLFLFSSICVEFNVEFQQYFVHSISLNQASVSVLRIAQ